MAAETSGYPLYIQAAVPQKAEQVERALQCFHSPLAQPPCLQQLPPALSYFTGRQAEISEAIAQLNPAHAHRPCPLVLTIVGPPSIGKSALALHLAHRWKWEFSDAQLYINLRGTERQPLQPSEVLADWLRAWGMSREAMAKDLDGRSQQFSTLLANQQTLLVLDNAQDAAQVRPLIPANCACVVLITSRSALTDLDVTSCLDLAPLPEEEALGLLQACVGGKTIQADPTMGLKISEFCHRSPLTIELLGSALKQSPQRLLPEVLAWLTTEQKRLSQLRLSYPEIRASFAFSYQNLNPTAARLLRLLGLLEETTFTAAIAAVLLETDTVTGEAAIAQLLNFRLIAALGRDRYRIAHDFIRLFARGQLATEEPAEARQAARIRIIHWYRDITAQLSLGLDPLQRQQFGSAEGPGNQSTSSGTESSWALAAMHWFAIEHLNLLTALDWAQQAEAWEVVLALTEHLGHFSAHSPQGKPWERVFSWGLEAAQKLSAPWEEARLLQLLGNLATQQHHWSQAADYYDRSLKQAHELGDGFREAQILANLGLLSLQQDQPDPVPALWQTALDRLAPHPLAQTTLKQWMQSVQPTLYKQITGTGNSAATGGIFQTIGGLLKRLLTE